MFYLNTTRPVTFILMLLKYLSLLMAVLLATSLDTLTEDIVLTEEIWTLTFAGYETYWMLCCI